MRLFNAQIINDRLESDGSLVISSAAYSCLLSRADAMKFFCVVEQVSNSPTVLIVLAGGAPDFNNPETTLLFLNTLSGPTTFTMTYSAANATYPPPKHLFVALNVTGTDASAHVKLWVCGRGTPPLEAPTPTSATFAAQLAAARMCDDENRLPGKKRMLRQGASLFYPPELFDPYAKWDR